MKLISLLLVLLCSSNLFALKQSYQQTHNQYKTYLANFRGSPKQVAAAFLLDKGPVIIQGLAMSKNLAFRKPYFKSVKFREHTVAGRFDKVAKHIDLNDFRLQLNNIINAGNVFKSWSLGVAGGADFVLGGSIEGGGVWSTQNTATALGYLTYSYNLGINLGGELALTMSLWTKDAHQIGGDMDAISVIKVGSQFGAEILVWLDIDKYYGSNTSIDAVIGFTFAPTIGISTQQATKSLKKAFTGKKAKGNKGHTFSADHARRHIYKNGREITNLPPLIDTRPIGKAFVKGATYIGDGTIKAANVVGKGTVKAANTVAKGTEKGVKYIGKGTVKTANTVGKGVKSIFVPKKKKPSKEVVESVSTATAAAVAAVKAAQMNAKQKKLERKVKKAPKKTVRKAQMSVKKFGKTIDNVFKPKKKVKAKKKKTKSVKKKNLKTKKKKKAKKKSVKTKKKN